MRALTATEQLWAWEHGLDQPAARRAITLLVPVWADSSPEEIARWPVGRRDARLLDLRECTFGSHLASLAECPACHATLELEFDVASVRLASETAPGTSPAPIPLRLGDCEFTFRLPDTLDLAAAAAAGTPRAARQRLLERCVAVARNADGDPIAPDGWTEETVAAIAARMAEADPQADVQLALACPQCHHEWSAPFDIAGFFWAELQASARRLLREIHELATAYGWSEARILALSAARRQAYLELVRA